MAQFLDALARGERMAFGKGFVLEPEWMGFSGVDGKIIRLLQDAAYVCRLEGSLVQTGLEAKYLPVADRFVPRLLQLLMAKPFRLSFGEEVVAVPCVFDGQAELMFGVAASWRSARRCRPRCGRWTGRAGLSIARATCCACPRSSGKSCG